jgi:hypothetical protein
LSISGIELKSGWSGFGCRFVGMGYNIRMIGSVTSNTTAYMPEVCKFPFLRWANLNTDYGVFVNTNADISYCLMSSGSLFGYVSKRVTGSYNFSLGININGFL